MKIVCIKNTIGYTAAHREVLFKEGVVYWYNINCKHFAFNQYNYSLYNTVNYENGWEGYIKEEDIKNFVIESEYSKEIKDLDIIFNSILDGNHM